MTEKLKTRSEVLKELDWIADTFNREINNPKLKMEVFGPNMLGGHHVGVRICNEKQTCTYTGINHSFTPDPDTKIQALEKAQKLHLELTAADTVKDCSLTNGMKYYVVDWVTKIDNWNHSEQFPFADPAPESEFITDEPPPEGTPIIINHGVEPQGKIVATSRGEFNGYLLLIDYYNPCLGRYIKDAYAKTYRSLTTPHRSKDWVDLDD